MSQTALRESSVKVVTAADVDVQLRTEATLQLRASPRLANTSKGRQIWWSNAIFFTVFHVVGLFGWYYWPSSWRTWFLCYINWQFGTLGITIGQSVLCFKLIAGYHRLWSHRSFTARLPLRIVLAAMGTLGFQGSIR